MTSNNKYLKTLPTDTSAAGVHAGTLCMCSVPGDCAWVEELKSVVFEDVTSRFKCSRRTGTLCMCSVALETVLGLRS